MKLDASDIAELEPVIRAAVVAVLDELRHSELARSEQLAFPEAQAAAMLGIAKHALRDCRLRGEIEGVRLGKRVAYTREALLRFLEKQRI